jgi:hypothetical protein
MGRCKRPNRHVLSGQALVKRSPPVDYALSDSVPADLAHVLTPQNEGQRQRDGLAAGAGRDSQRTSGLPEGGNMRGTAALTPGC